MTNEELRKIDALIAEKVFGIVGPWTRSIGCNVCGSHEWYWKEGRALPPYSSSIAAAWAVVEKLDLLSNYELSKENSGIGSPGKWTIGINDREDGYLFAEADTAPLAICLAALRVCKEAGK